VEIGTWLRGLGLERYEQAFRQGEVDCEVLSDLTDDDLRELGIPLGSRKKLLKAIAALSGSQRSAEPGLAATAIAVSVPGGERRQVTILFADLSGYTRLSRELDAEDLHVLLGHFFRCVDSVVAEHGGTIDKHIGDCVMAVFGAPVAHDNDPARAAHAALAIREAMPAVSRETARSVGVHIGIAAGQVVASGTGSATHLEYTVTGESVNLASRLTDRASDGEILISEGVRRLLSETFSLRPAGTMELQGIAEPVVAWQLIGIADVAPVHERPFVGRRAELAQVEGALRACIDIDAGQVIHIRGEAGIGKSRLIEEFQRLAGALGFASHATLVLDFGSGTRRDAIRSLCRALLDLAPASEVGHVAAAATAAVEANLIADAHRGFLNDLLDLPQPPPLDVLYEAMDHATRYQGKRETLAELVSNVARRRPRLLIVEDLHWADRVTLDYLSNLARAVAGCPALLITTSRLEGDPLNQAWRASVEGTTLMTLDLGPLRAGEAAALAGVYPGAGSDFARRCVERAAGNPLFLEQLLRHAEETLEGVVPGTVQSLVQARMDQLDPVDRQALQVASVFGQRFSLDALRHLLGSPGYTPARLIERQLVKPVGDDLLFGHALIRDATYDTLLRARRHELHGAAAAWFGDDDPVLKAGHLDRADDPAAASAYLAAAQSEAAAYRYQRARQLIERGLQLAAARDVIFALTCHYGELLHDLGAMQESAGAFERAFAAADDDAQRCRVWLGLAGVKRVTDDVDGALADLEKAEQAARRHDLKEQLARIHFVRGNLLFPRGDIEGCLREHQASLELARAIASVELEVQALGGLGDAEYVRGRMRSAHGNFQRCVALSREHGFRRIEVANEAMVAHSGLYFRPQRAVLAQALASAEAARGVGHQRAELNARGCALFACDTLMDFAELRAQARLMEPVVSELGAFRFDQARLKYLARAETLEGRRTSALALLDEALSLARKTGMGFQGPRIFGSRALALEDPKQRRQALVEGEVAIENGCVGHNQPWFYADAIQTMLDLRDWAGVERYARALETFTSAEPLAWCDLFIARGRTLAAFLQGARDGSVLANLARVRDEARRLEMLVALPAIDRALTTMNTRTA
jgi:class 3 adenylate cyclase/tetratricopeptide (TPR) repeat protein